MVQYNLADLWSSPDGGATWARAAAPAGGSPPPPRTFPLLAALPDGSVALAAGYDSWDRFTADAFTAAPPSAADPEPAGAWRQVPVGADGAAALRRSRGGGGGGGGLPGDDGRAQPAEREALHVLQ